MRHPSPTAIAAATAIAALLLTPRDLHAQTLGEPGKEIVFLLKDCAAAGHTNNVDCFESLPGLNAFIWDASTGLHPSASDPLIVDIGPGDFAGAIVCPLDGGHVTFRGAGRDRSRLTGPSSPNFLQVKATVLSYGCDELEFQDLRLESPNVGVYWILAGSSTWTDVDVKAGKFGWYDTLCNGDSSDPPAGLHYFYGSKMESEEVGFFGNCGETWFYGSEILARPEGAAGTPIGLQVAGRSDVRVFGGTVRVITSDATSGSGGVATGVSVSTGPGGFGPGGTFHMHGGIVSVDASAIVGMEARGLYVDGAGGGSVVPSAHTPDAAFALRPGDGGAATRVAGPGSIRSPFLWPSGTTPPHEPTSATALGSITGKDLFVETDCGASGCSGGGDAHLMIYQESCEGVSGTPWFDVVTGTCRVP